MRAHTKHSNPLDTKCVFFSETEKEFRLKKYWSFSSQTARSGAPNLEKNVAHEGWNPEGWPKVRAEVWNSKGGAPKSQRVGPESPKGGA